MYWLNLFGLTCIICALADDQLNWNNDMNKRQQKTNKSDDVGLKSVSKIINPFSLN